MSELEKKKKFSLPSTPVLLFLIIVVIMILTYIIPAGTYERVFDEASGRNVVDPASFQYVEQSPVNPWKMFVSIPDAFVEVGNIIFLIAFGFFWVYSVMQSGALTSAINKLLGSKAKDSKLFIPICMFIFAIAGSTYGELETVYGLVPIFVALAIALGYDAIVGLCMCFVGVATGFASATTNAFTIGVAQSIAELPIFSGLVYRWIIFFVQYAVMTFMVMRYANKVKKNPEASYVKDCDFSSFELERVENVEFTAKQKIILISMIFTVATIVYGSLKLGFWINEMSAVFIISALIISIIAGFKPEQVKDNLLTAFKEMAIGMVVVGLARAILIIMQNGVIIDTVVHGLASVTAGLGRMGSAIGMLVAQNIINFFIPSGSGQATAIMPIMVPLGDLAGVTRQVTVLAYQFGDGYSNMLWPTCSVATMCGIGKIPLDRWYKFFIPVYAVCFCVQVILLIIAVAIGYA
ncbi:MAG: YfcC family protein [Firmicutes bacterium]|nr:YfcC family protein [Bacillota bacterium]MBR3034855.1 YfcC family protein [Bacillota bacterium]MBR3749506.1 YfcC family protein [Bacillota bacterium]MBR6969819.1 YfcC family protein [Bacillota bacterium]